MATMYACSGCKPTLHTTSACGIDEQSATSSFAETALVHQAGVLHADSDFEPIQKVRPSLLLKSL